MYVKLDSWGEWADDDVVETYIYIDHAVLIVVPSYLGSHHQHPNIHICIATNNKRDTTTVLILLIKVPIFSTNPDRTLYVDRLRQAIYDCAQNSTVYTGTHNIDSTI